MIIYVRVDPRECFRLGVPVSTPGIFAPLPPMPEGGVGLSRGDR